MRGKKYGKAPRTRRVPNILFLNKIKTQSDVSKPESWQPESSGTQRSTFRREREMSNGPRFQGVSGRGSCNQRAGEDKRDGGTKRVQGKIKSVRDRWWTRRPGRSWKILELKTPIHTSQQTKGQEGLCCYATCVSASYSPTPLEIKRKT